jgi:predicted O-linked N-acetylglucosamine transferase (SPINDLY family)
MTDDASLRAQAEAALVAWHTGSAAPSAVLAILRRSASTAVDFSNLGAVLRADGDHASAEIAYRDAVALDATCAAAHYNLGNLLADTGRVQAAADAYRSATAARPEYAEAWNALGVVVQRQGHLEQAEEAFRAAATHAPNWVEAQTNVGVALMGLEKYDAAERALRAAINLDPKHAAAYGNLGALLLRGGAPVTAEAASRTALQLAPQEHRWISNLAGALQMQCRHREAEAAYRRALAMRPDYASGHGNLLFALNYRDDLPAAAIFAEYRSWDAAHARRLRAVVPSFANPPLAGRRLKVGYVSADFRTHAVALFSEPLLAAHDRSRIELTCYAEVVLEDATTERFKAITDHWRSTVGLSDEQVDALIRQDGIDVLVDLGGHTAANRLLAFARKPAPVQVEYILGHGYTSGLSAMDAFFADDALAPPEADALFSERLIRLPRIPLTYQPPPEMPAVAPLPALACGHVTFGYFGRPERLNGPVIAAWSRILAGVPDARLVLNNRNFQEPAFRALFTAHFAEHGISEDRLDLTYTTPQPTTWAAYGDVDIALDPFPHNAGTTTIEALWLGVPVVSLAGRPSVGRFGASIMRAMDLDDWVAHDTDGYIARAIAAANDLPALAQLRAELRARFAASPLADAPGLARAIEAAFFDLVDNALAANANAATTAELRNLFASGKKVEAKRLAHQVLAENPADPTAAHVAAIIAYDEDRLIDADRLISVAIAATPDDPEVHGNHAAILRSLGRLNDGEAAARRSVALAPNRPETLNNLGNILRDLGRYDESITAFNTAVKISPRFADAWANLAWVLSLSGRAKEAEDASRRAIEAEPENHNGHNNLGLALMRQSRLREAETTLRRAMALKPDLALPHSNVLFCLNYRDDLTAEEIFAEYRAWDRQHAIKLMPADPAFTLDRTPGRRLRVGYVSPDFRTHAVALFAEPLLAAHDASQIELFCYAEVPVEDATTKRFRALADHWRSTLGLTDAAVAALIRSDKIDVLIDLAGHTAGNRLQAFARKPAPVLIEYMLGHGYTSGLSAIDGFLADDHLAPPGAEHLFSEQLIRLPRIPLAYRPPADMPPVAPLPALKYGYVTFGYFGRTVRLTDDVVATWARILHAVPRSKLVLNSSPFAEPAGRTLYAARFAAHGIAAHQLVLTCTSPQPVTWAAYGQIDIALDPFPHNAGTTTIEALWQGVPVLSMACRPTVGRFGAAILHTVGLDDWVTTDADLYVARAQAAVSDLPALAQLRSELRGRFANGPMGDASGLARAVETACRTLWDEWREGARTRLRRQFAEGKRDDARAFANRLLVRDPEHPDALHVLGVLAFEAQDPARAVELLGRARPTPDILVDRGVALRGLGRHTEAEASYRKAIALQPGHIHALGNLGNLLLDSKRGPQADAAFTEALTHAPDQIWLMRGKALAALMREFSAEVEPVLRRALTLAPDDADLHETLAALLGQNGRTLEAETHHRAALPRIGDRHRCLSNLAVMLQTQGRHAETEACYREALALRPDYAPAHSNLLFSLNYRDDMPAYAIFAEYRAWNERHARTLTLAAPPLDAEPLDGRRLRIGYVSPDFRSHAVALFAEPLLAAHDKSTTEIFCYAEVAVEDAVTARFRTHSDHWRSTVGLNEDQIAAQIRADRIDVLIDMAGHTAGSRLLVFARKPAPVQVQYILGHGYTSGMDAMDAFLADDVLAPPEADALFAERLIRLPRIPLAYRPPEGMPPVSAPPGLANGHITFGHFGRPERLTARVVETWADILHVVPGARLMLNSRPFFEPAFRDLFAKRFAARGIERDRLDLLYTHPQPRTWEAYGRIDIALDPFPHNAGTTTIEALWQGVPVVTLADRPPVGRFGASILHSVGLDEWATITRDDYIARAVEAAGDIDTLTALRHELRGRLAGSSLCDANGLARCVEGAARMLFEAWQAGRSTRLAAD